LSFIQTRKTEFVEAARFYEDQTTGLGLEFTVTVQRTYERLLRFPARGVRSVVGCAEYSFRSALTAFSNASSLIGSASSPSSVLLRADHVIQ
jgi:hypothetical protein